MATLCIKTGKTPGYEIQFFDTNGKRLTIYLGGRRYTEKTARELKTIVEELVLYRDNPSLPPRKSTLKRIDEFPQDIQQKLAGVGLAKITPTHSVKELWETFLKQKGGIKDSTLTTYETAKERFFSFFKGNELLTELTSATMQRWKTYLRTEMPRERSTRRGLAESTVAGTLAKAKAVFNWALKSAWIETSPLTGVGRGSFVNEENDRIITMDEYHRLLDACPCQDWRVIIALARIGGLRAPSEVLRLRWSDVNWARSRFYATSPKTERYKNKEGRLVPLFPELREELIRLFELDSSVGKEFVINRYRDPKRTNLGTQFGRIVKLAGIQPILRPFDNMRASRSIEVYAEHGDKAEEQWIGHSSEIAKKHYRRVHEGNFSRAVSKETDWSVLGDSTDYGRNGEEGREKSNFPALEKVFPAVFPAVGIGIGRNGSEVKKSKSAVNP
jgi:integrase